MPGALNKMSEGTAKRRSASESKEMIGFVDMVIKDYGDLVQSLEEDDRFSGPICRAANGTTWQLHFDPKGDVSAVLP